MDIFADVEIESYEFTDEELEALNDLLEDELEEEEEEEEEETEEETKSSSFYEDQMQGRNKLAPAQI